MEYFLIFFLLLFIIASAIVTYLYFKSKKQNKTLQDFMLQNINDNEIKMQQVKNTNTAQFWVIDKYDDNDLKKIKLNLEVLDSVVRILTYYTAISSDVLREETDTNKILRASGRSNAYHEMLFFFYKLKPEKKTKEPIE